MKDYHSMSADRMSAELREMAELAPTPDLQECYQRAAALLGGAQGARCTECDCTNGGSDCNWIKSSDGIAEGREAAPDLPVANEHREAQACSGALERSLDRSDANPQGGAVAPDTRQPAAGVESCPSETIGQQLLRVAEDDRYSTEYVGLLFRGHIDALRPALSEGSRATPDLQEVRECFERIRDFPYVGAQASHAIVNIAKAGLLALDARALSSTTLCRPSSGDGGAQKSKAQLAAEALALTRHDRGTS